MQNCEQASKSRNYSMQAMPFQVNGLLTGETAAAVIDKLVYHTPLANDHILHELEERYGAAMAYYIMQRLPK